MEISDILSSKAILLNLKGKNRKEVLNEFFDVIKEHIPNSDVSNIIECLEQRECIQTTAIGNGIAIPHSKVKDLHDIHLFMGIHKEGVDFNALDKKPVYVIFCLLWATNSENRNIYILSELSKFVKQDKLVNEMLLAHDEKDCLKRILSLEKEQD